MATPGGNDAMSGGGLGRGRGRGRIGIIPIQKPADVREINTTVPTNQIESSISSITSASSEISEQSTEISPSTQEKPRRGNPGKIMERLATNFGKMSMGSITSEGSRLPYGIHSSEVPVTRPEHLADKRGSNGNSIRLVANYVKILSNPTWELFVYHVDFIPEDLFVDRRLRRDAITQHHDVLHDVAFNGQTIWSFESFGNERRFNCHHPISGAECEFKLRFISKFLPNSPEFFNLINLIIRKLFECAGLKLIGRNYYQYDRMISINNNLRIFPGFLSNVNVYEGILLMNIDLSHKIINKTTVYDCLRRIITNNNGNMIRAQEQAIRELVGQIIWTKYNSKTYRIDDIDWINTPKMKFSKKNGTEQMLIEYYEERYQIKIHDKDQPLIISRPSKRNRRAGINQNLLLIPELCLMTGLSEFDRRNFSLMKEINSLTQVDPMNRMQNLNKFITDIHQNDQCKELLEKWNIQLDNQFIEFDTRIVDAETIIYGDRMVQYNNAEQADWSRDGRMAKHISPKNLSHWFVLVPRPHQPEAINFINALQNVCRPFGMHIAYPKLIELKNDRIESYLHELETNLSHLSTSIDFILCILTKPDRYMALKKYLCLDFPIPSQMILVKTLNRSNQLMSIATRIGIQINAKLGGEIWSVHIPTKTLMIIGIDIYHKRKCGTYAGFVATINPQCTRFYSRVIVNQTSQVLFDHFSECITEALKSYYRLNGILPKKIIVYRDGGSDGELPIIIEHEVKQIINTFQLVQIGYDPKLAVIVVNKRGNTRFFAKINNKTIINPPPGTVIDHVITNTLWYDFYLISQHTKQGTVAPTHYNIIWDQTNLEVDHMQRLTFKLCHLYYNWPGTIRIPAVCQYAHKLAYLAGDALHQVPHPSLAEKLFYL